MRMKNENMKKPVSKFEAGFERMSEISHRLLGSPLVILLVLAVVTVWFAVTLLLDTTIIDKIRDCFIGVSFVTFFLVQRALHKFNAAIHVKLDELVRAHENASNDLINVEQKTVAEIQEISKEIQERNE